MNQPTIETKRCIIRPILSKDIDGMFELDSNPKVHTYLGKKPITTIAEAAANIKSIQKQYEERKIGRWAVVEKASGKFIGWTGFRINSDFVMNNMENVFDLGYRFIESAWGKGYASETAFACMKYAFTHLEYDPIYGAAEVSNIGSNKILQKVGMQFVNEFEFDGEPHYFYKISKSKWLAQHR